MSTSNNKQPTVDAAAASPVQLQMLEQDIEALQLEMRELVHTKTNLKLKIAKIYFYDGRKEDMLQVDTIDNMLQDVKCQLATATAKLLRQKVTALEDSKRAPRRPISSEQVTTHSRNMTPVRNEEFLAELSHAAVHAAAVVMSREDDEIHAHDIHDDDAYESANVASKRRLDPDNSSKGRVGKKAKVPCPLCHLCCATSTNMSRHKRQCVKNPENLADAGMRPHLDASAPASPATSQENIPMLQTATVTGVLSPASSTPSAAAAITSPAAARKTFKADTTKMKNDWEDAKLAKAYFTFRTVAKGCAVEQTKSECSRIAKLIHFTNPGSNWTVAESTLMNTKAIVDFIDHLVNTLHLKTVTNL